MVEDVKWRLISFVRQILDEIIEDNNHLSEEEEPFPTPMDN